MVPESLHEPEAFDLAAMQRRLRELGLLRPEDTLSQRDWNVIVHIADYCGGIGDQYVSGEHTCGDEIRASFGLG